MNCSLFFLDIYGMIVAEIRWECVAMKRLFFSILILLFLLPGCAPRDNARIAATTLPVYEFTSRICAGTDITVTQLVTENVSCLHDYSVSVRQMRAIESAELIIINGAGLEHFMEDLLDGKQVIDASTGLELLESEEEGFDPHIWLSPEKAEEMVAAICAGLSVRFPQHTQVFSKNAQALTDELRNLENSGKELLSSLSCRELITFHDGFAYFAEAFDLEILEAVEEESGSEASASVLKALIDLTREHDLPAIFVEKNGSDAAARVIAAETGVKVFELDMAMSGDSYLSIMRENINTIKEALG